MPNTKIVRNTKTLTWPNFPELPPNKSNAIITKHFTNSALYLPQNETALLLWLLYQAHADNTIIYNTQLLRRYCRSVYEANKEYNKDFKALRKPNGLGTSIKHVRFNLITLIQAGYLIRISADKIMINPMLTYYEYLSRKEYNEIMAKYQFLSHESLIPFCLEYVKLVNKKING